MLSVISHCGTNHTTIFQSGYTILRSRQRCWGFQLLTTLTNAWSVFSISAILIVMLRYLTGVFFLYRINIYFKNKCVVVNSTIWCRCLYYSCLGKSCLTLHYFCTILGKLYLSIIMNIVLTSWTPWIMVLVCTFHPDFTLLIYAPSSDLLKSIFSSAFSTATKNWALFMCFLS